MYTLINMKHDATHIEVQSSNDTSKLRLVPNESRKKPSNDLLGYSHDSFLKIWHEMYGIDTSSIRYA